MIYDAQGNAWLEVAKEPPPSDTPLMTAIYDAEGGWRNEQSLVLSRRLWFFPDMSMYVCYRPTHWRPITGVTDKKKMADYTIPPAAKAAEGAGG